jgi:glycosyltransferase involved in cell wall biosynthesis
MLSLKNTSLIKKIFELRRVLKKNKVDVLINVDTMLGIFSLPATILTKTKVIAWEMFNIRNDIGSKHTKFIRSYSLKHCAYYVNQTKGDMLAFKEQFKIKCPITYIHNYCDENSDYTEYDQNSKTILTAGHFFFTKGYDLAVEIARHVFKVHPDWTWRFVGDGLNEKKIKEKVKEYGLENNVIFAGRTKDIAKEYKNASIYVLSSRTEGFGLVLTEAKSYNLPIVSFDVDFGPREIIEHEKSGFLVEPFNVEKMASRINELIENKEKRLEFSKRAKDNLHLFSKEKFVSKWIEILEKV